MIDPAWLIVTAAGSGGTLWGVTSWLKRGDCVPRRPARRPVIRVRAQAAPVVSGPHKGMGAGVVAGTLPSGEPVPGDLARRLGLSRPAVAVITGPARDPGEAP